MPFSTLIVCMFQRIGSVRWRDGRLAFSEVICLKGLFVHRTKPKQRLNIGGVEVGGRESPEVGRTLVENCRGLRSANYDHGWSVSMMTNWIKMRTQYIHTNGLSHYFLFWKVAPLFGYLGYLFPYCQPVCHVISNVRDGWIDKLSEYRVTCEV